MGDKTDRAKGKLKEKAGEVKGDPGLAESGRREQIKGNLKASGKKSRTRPRTSSGSGRSRGNPSERGVAAYGRRQPRAASSA